MLFKVSFQFSVLSKLAPERDGYLSEGFGMMAWHFIKDEPLKFSRNIIDVKNDFPIDNNLENWSQKVHSELSISSGSEECTGVEKYINHLKRQSFNFSKEETSACPLFHPKRAVK